MIRPFDPPLTREQFERRLYLLREALIHDRLHFASGLSASIDGIRRVHLLPNRRIDLLSVDETTRLQANMMDQFARFSPPALSSDISMASSLDPSAEATNEVESGLKEP